MKDKVSIIVPFYKKKIFFEKCIKSITSQTYKNIEVFIIFDDTDFEDLEFVKKKIKNKKKIRLIINKKNLGVSKSRNIGIYYSKGKYIAFLDADDFWDKNKLKIQINYMKKNKSVISHTNYKIIDYKNKIIGKMNIKKKLSYEDLMKSCDIGLSTVVIDRKILKKNPFAKINTKEDYILWLKLVKKYQIFGIRNYTTYWRKTNESLSSNLFQKLHDAFKVYFFYENKSIFNSLYLTIRLSLYSLIKKFNQKYI